MNARARRRSCASASAPVPSLDAPPSPLVSANDVYVGSEVSSKSIDLGLGAVTSTYSPAGLLFELAP